MITAATGTARQVFLASSAAVYGHGSGPFRESDQPKPASAYGQSKLDMEHNASALGQDLGVKVTSLRIGNMIGADMLSRNVANKQHIVLDRFPDGTTPRRSCLDPSVLGAVLDALMKSERRDELPEVLNLASVPVLDMAELLRAARIPFDMRPAPEGARSEVALDMSLIQTLVPAGVLNASAEQAVDAWRRYGGLQ